MRNQHLVFCKGWRGDGMSEQIKKIIAETLRRDGFSIKEKDNPPTIEDGFQMTMVKSNKSETKDRVILVTLQRIE